MVESLVKKKKEQLNRRALFSARTGSYSGIKKYHADILQFEKESPLYGKVMTRLDWDHFHNLWRNMATDAEKRTYDRAQKGSNL